MQSSNSRMSEITVDREIFVVKIFHRWPTTTKIRRTKIFRRRSDKVKIALLGYMKPVRGLPDHCKLFSFSDVTNSIRVRLAPCVTYTHLWLSHKFIFGVFNFRRCVQHRKYYSTKISRSTVHHLHVMFEILCLLARDQDFISKNCQEEAKLDS